MPTNPQVMMGKSTAPPPTELGDCRLMVRDIAIACSTLMGKSVSPNAVQVTAFAHELIEGKAKRVMRTP